MNRNALNSSSNSLFQIGILALLLALCGCLILAFGGLWASTSLWSESLAAATPTQPPTPPHSHKLVDTPTPQPTVCVRPSPPKAMTTEERLLLTELPQRDIRLLAERLKKTGPIPEIVHQTPPVYELGQESRFWVGNVDTMEQFDVSAVLRHITPHLYIWVETCPDCPEHPSSGACPEQSEGSGRGDRPQTVGGGEGMIRSAENFEAHIYPTVRAFFGSEWSPGVDGDPRLHILHASGAHLGGSVAGYYSSADEVSRLANPYSNEREMFYISLDGPMPGTDFYDGLLAHEFQHMIHWANDRNEETWVNEGCSELAAYLCGHDPGGFEWAFVRDPDVQLTTWPQSASATAHYGGSYLFMAYFLGRFGEEATKQVVAHPENGTAGFDAVLSAYGLTFEDAFADWLIANYVDNIADNVLQGEARYTYPDHVVGPVSIDVVHNEYPVQRESTVHQYAADYITLEIADHESWKDLSVEIAFAGNTEALLVPADAHSGRFAWWSNRGDESDTTLTRAFDLRAVEQATLQLWTWYDIETDWDYAYVEASVDGGQTWDILSGSFTTTSNPNGNSFGPAYTGQSEGWIEDRFDLSPYAGQEVLVRFEYVTDDAVNGPGWLIDDIAIPELGYKDDLESGPGGWQSAGFLYSDNRVRQRYLVQLIVWRVMDSHGLHGRQSHVLRMALDAAQRGSLELQGLGSDVGSAVLVVSALAPSTTEAATYRYEIRPLDR